MATVNAAINKAALDGVTSHLSGGDIRFDTAGDVEVAVLPISWAAASSATPAVSVGTATADSSPNDDATITKFLMRTSGAATRINGSVGVGSGDLQITNNVVPVGATSVSCPGGFSLSLTITA